MPRLATKGGLAAAAHPCAHRIFGCFERGFVKIQRRCKRRRNSFKLVIFFSVQTGLMFIVFLSSFIMHKVVDVDELIVKEQCGGIPNLPGQFTDSDLKNLTTSGSVSCTGPDGSEIDSISACRASERSAVKTVMMVVGLLAMFQFVLSFVLAMCFLMFTNLPAEVLQHGSKSNKRCTDFVGFMCKSGPCVARFLHVLLVMGVVLIGVASSSTASSSTAFCQGRLRFTANCAGYRADCYHNKFKNCLYYYSFCRTQANIDKGVCYSTEEKAVSQPANDPRTMLLFSGRMDIRLLPGTKDCLCALLANDLANNPTAGAAAKDNYWISSPGVATIRFQVPSSCTAASFVSDPTAQAPANGNAAVEEQHCKWTPFYAGTRKGGAPFIFGRDACYTERSFFFKRFRIYGAAVTTGTVVLIVAGQTTRVLSQPEPWFFRPAGRKDNIFLRFLRLTAP